MSLVFLRVYITSNKNLKSDLKYFIFWQQRYHYSVIAYLKSWESKLLGSFIVTFITRFDVSITMLFCIHGLKWNSQIGNLWTC